MLVVHDGRPVLVPEAAIPLEQQLHDLLTEHPQLLPLSDMGLGRTVVVAKEAPLKAGFADLILVDERGEICIVEIKKEGNPDTRQVIAQLIDYAASLWTMSVDEFDRGVFGASIGRDSPAGLAEHLGESFEEGDTNSPETISAARIIQQLETKLEVGDFLMAIAAPTLSLTLRRSIEYQNERGSRIYGIEFSYFVSPEGTQCLLPQLVVAPPIRTQPAARDENRILEASGNHRDLIVKLIDAAVTAGAETKPTTDFISVVARNRQGGVTPMYMSPNAVTIAVKNPGGKFPDGPFLAAGERLQSNDLGTVGGVAMYRRVPYDRVPEDKKDELVGTVSELFGSLLGTGGSGDLVRPG
jgi:hypothetical protein